MPPQERAHYSDDDIRSAWVDEPPQLNSTVTLADYDPAWPELFQREAERIRTVLGEQVRQLEHVGSTSVPGLCAKPIIDILLVVPDSSDEPGYLAALEAAGYRLVIREPEQDEHRALKGPDTNINLHVYSPGSVEIEHYLRFRDRLRDHDSERDRYAAVKRELAARTWKYIQHYADAKNEIVDEIMARAEAAEASATPVAYDEFAERYADHSATNPFQKLYDRPAILNLAGEVAGLRVLDAGCAAGYLAAELARRGARVTGIDASEQLLAIARERNSVDDSVVYRHADLAEPLEFLADDSVDLITASLVLHYLRDWAPTLAEFRRVLRPGGAVVLSVHHPEDWHWFEGTRYFETELLTDEWSMGDAGTPQRVQFYRRPLSATFAAVRAAGFTVDELAEPQPLPECETTDPGAFAMLTGGPRFLYLRLISPAS
ncbi:GrpB family protein [Actinoalloteichus hymeniacidonis]|uniref:Methyltransferase type 11 domain-containing protein n=1 Tax=Actinoalloteichus hymeniacidonis TaxID=340345 RepID=A0AAC9MZD2_9PSEU|nr:GrpB family protein [Actinoalloteichus hymeniacidonis]AOS65278.1 hypothetical protein TL08_22480 [Actinoalloteichus hymeniacidonis]MBB5906638.1 GrpB-like predicted nucleotidyltransferase (UPF0157 family) [Actinoalloteichus hymeniacidonis]